MLKRRPSPGTVLGALALIVAVAGNANAFAGRNIVIHKGDIAKGAVTAKALAKNSVTSKALAKGSVTARAIKGGAVGASALATNAVTSPAIAPGSVYGAALGEVTVHSVPIVDVDQSADLSTWTFSNVESANCGPGEQLLTGGVNVSIPANNRVGIIRSLPISGPGRSDGYQGQITSDSGGLAAAEVEAICLK